LFETFNKQSSHHGTWRIDHARKLFATSSANCTIDTTQIRKYEKRIISKLESRVPAFQGFKVWIAFVLLETFNNQSSHHRTYCIDHTRKFFTKSSANPSTDTTHDKFWRGASILKFSHLEFQGFKVRMKFTLFETIQQPIIPPNRTWCIDWPCSSPASSILQNFASPSDLWSACTHQLDGRCMWLIDRSSTFL